MPIKKLITYYNDPKIKENILKQLQVHYDADEIIKGIYWENGKGCAVGCTIYSGNHLEYESKFGIPIILARLEDRIFEGLPNNLAKEWPIKFMNAINVGADLSNVWKKFVVWLLSDTTYGVFKYAESDESKNAIKLVTDLYEEWIIKEIEPQRFREARKAAVAYYAAYAAAAYAVDTCAVDAAAYAVDYDACAVDVAADAVAYDAACAVYARQSHYIAQSEKLLELLKCEK